MLHVFMIKTPLCRSTQHSYLFHDTFPDQVNNVLLPCSADGAPSSPLPPKRLCRTSCDLAECTSAWNEGNRGIDRRLSNARHPAVGTRGPVGVVVCNFDASAAD
ncbi:hypothetical protein LSAT2_018944 [Lamellibrachia satsuma]|nr:hypothetical protein LSAT2_018944 [Lamellibrachia satsuma]